jgi:hypothetical protein
VNAVSIDLNFLSVFLSVLCATFGLLLASDTGFSGSMRDHSFKSYSKIQSRQLP